MPEITIPLDIPDVEIVSSEFKDGHFILHVKSTVEGTTCHRCKKWIIKRHSYAEEITLRHLPILDREVIVRIRPVRYECPDCDNHPTTTQQLNWYDKKNSCTKAYEDYLLRRLVNSTLKDVCHKEKLTYKILAKIVEKKIQDKVDWGRYSKLDIIGLDEIALKKGYQDYVVIVSAKIDGQLFILAVLKDRKRETIEAFFRDIPAHLVNTINSVCCDMYDNFILAAEAVLGNQAKIVIDRFHVSQLYRKALDKLRSKELKRLKASLSIEEYATLHGAMWSLRKKKEYLNTEDKKILEQLFSYSLDLKMAYEFVLKLTHIFNSHLSKRSALRKINCWIKSVEESGLNCFNKFILTLKKYKTYIANYFNKRHNSGFVEGLNNKAKLIKRRCYGILKPVTLFKRLFIDIELGRMAYA